MPSEGVHAGPTERARKTASRWREFEGEWRCNLARLAAIASFYAIELANHHGARLGVFELPPVSGPEFHRAATAVAIAALGVALAVQLCLRGHFLPEGLKYLATAADLALLTLMLCLADGPRSPLVGAYFVLLAMAALRFSPTLVRMATCGALLSYGIVLAQAAWYSGRDIRIPRYHQLFMIACLLLSGFTLGQVIRAARELVVDRGPTVDPKPEGSNQP